jgi:hypothetical protein
MPLNIATKVSFKDENEGGDAVVSKADKNGSTANAVKAKVINGHAKQKAINDATLPPTAKYSEACIPLDTFETCFLSLEAVSDLRNSTKQLLLTCAYLLTSSLNFLRTKKISSKIHQKA